MSMNIQSVIEIPLEVILECVETVSSSFDEATLELPESQELDDMVTVSKETLSMFLNLIARYIKETQYS